MSHPKQKVKRSADQTQISISLPRRLLAKIKFAAANQTHGNRSKLVAAALIGLFKTNKLEEMVSAGLAQEPMTQSEMLKAAFALISKGDPNAARILKRSDFIKTAFKQP